MAGVTSSYPAVLDSESNLIPPNNGDTLSVADHWLAGNAGPIVAIETELGTDPAGYATDVKTRLDDINPSEGNLNLDAGYGSKAPIYGVRAWVNFDGTTNVAGNCTIRASANVSSVADNSTGRFTVNFTSAMPDANYSFAVTGSRANGSLYWMTGPISVPTTSSIEIGGDASTYGDSEYISCTIFR